MSETEKRLQSVDVQTGTQQGILGPIEGHDLL